jgi:hypothetical protein
MRRSCRRLPAAAPFNAEPFPAEAFPDERAARLREVAFALLLFFDTLARVLRRGEWVAGVFV